MKNLLTVLMVFVAPVLAHAASEEAPSPAMDTVKRTGKKMGHRMQEAVCAKGDAKCAAEKAGHRMEEGKDFVKDKVKENVK